MEARRAVVEIRQRNRKERTWAGSGRRPKSLSFSCRRLQYTAQNEREGPALHRGSQWTTACSFA